MSAIDRAKRALVTLLRALATAYGLAFDLTRDSRGVRKPTSAFRKFIAFQELGLNGSTRVTVPTLPCAIHCELAYVALPLSMVGGMVAPVRHGRPTVAPAIPRLCSRVAEIARHCLAQL